jgi:hypothetical protein
MEITYRLIFGMTPLGGTKKDCSLSNSIEETEEFIFLHCCIIQPVKAALEEDIQRYTGADVSTERAVMLNTIPRCNPPDFTKALQLMAEYVQLVWACRIVAKFEDKFYTTESILHIFNQRRKLINEQRN